VFYRGLPTLHQEQRPASRVIEKLLKEEYWPLGYYCVVEWGESNHKRPDIAVLKPGLATIETL